MNNQYKMDYYQPEETMNFEQSHTILYSFQYENAFAQVVTTMSGNVSGGFVMSTEFDTGLSVSVDHELNKKHVTFFSSDDKDKPYREVGEINFQYPDGEIMPMDLEEASNFLIGVQIIDYRP